ncbi:MAG TPA: DUF2182 domain-containing protein [Acidobacteriaceae bacterium]|nr:DUF2182 domain-containing protein [Acidobacteriaceae bacterium]
MTTQILHNPGTRKEWPAPRLELQALLGVSALLFVLSAALTVAWCGSMSSMGTMAMPGGWTMSMTWMRMPGQTWVEAAASFLGMWVAMMVAMMLPSLVPALHRYRRAIATAEGSRAASHRLTGLVAAAYFFVWTLLGVAIFPVGVALAALEMRSSLLARCVPTAAGVVVLFAGALQFTAWKAHHLACCREAPGTEGTMAADARTAGRIGLRLGLHCVYGCAGMTAILLVAGVMNIGAMAMVTAAISLERLAPRGERFARAIGAVAVAAGILLVARAAGMPV